MGGRSRSPWAFNKQEGYPLRYVAVDLETTPRDYQGRTVNEPIEIGAVRVEGGRVVAEWSTLIRPLSHEVSAMTTKVTGITYRDVKRAPFFYSVADQFREFIGTDIVLAHNAGYDVGSLYYAYHDLNTEFLPLYICSLSTARKVRPDFTSYKLGALAQYYGITQKAQHRALDDARVASNVFEALRIDSASLSSRATPPRNQGTLSAPQSSLPFSPQEGAPLAGEGVLVTGVFAQYSREDLHRIIEQLGGTVKKSISGKVTCIIVGADPGMRKVEFIQKRYEQGIPLRYLGEPDIVSMVRQASPMTTSQRILSDVKDFLRRDLW